ncbi:hypothetical protein FKM82_020574 [Ascaphus truei]
MESFFPGAYFRFRVGEVKKEIGGSSLLQTRLMADEDVVRVLVQASGIKVLSKSSKKKVRQNKISMQVPKSREYSSGKEQEHFEDEQKIHYKDVMRQKKQNFNLLGKAIFHAKNDYIHEV